MAGFRQKRRIAKQAGPILLIVHRRGPQNTTAELMLCAASQTRIVGLLYRTLSLRWFAEG
jgi:hypothetical protein